VAQSAGGVGRPAPAANDDGETVATISAGRKFYDDQVRFCETRDIPGIRSHYTDDATLITLDDQIHGGDAIAEYFRGYLARMAGLKVRSTDRFVETGDAILLEATVDLDAGVARVYDAFVLRGGRARYHFAGVLEFTPKG
jgi:ketosteroid isomerase-like protein